MLIREEQIATLKASHDGDLINRIAKHVKQRYPEHVAGVPPPEVKRRVRMCVDRARAFGVTWESCLASFTVMAFVYGPGFYNHPAIRAVLDDEKSDPNIRVKLLPSRTRRRVWREAAAQPRVWQ